VSRQSMSNSKSSARKGWNFVDAANSIYGILLILFVIFMPRGILGWLEAARRPRAGAAAPAE
jgi:ABC-type branched-subunit amino acid transport system permease subunit